MFVRILRHEWRLLTSDATVGALIGIFVVSIGYGTMNGARWVAFQRQAIADTAAEERQRYAQHEAGIRRINAGELKVSPFADPRNPGTVGRGFGSRYATLPPAPLAALSIGQSDLLPYYFRMTTDAKETVTAAAELENPQRLLAGRFDLAFVLIYLYPLLILALSYNLLSAEREQGTLAMALSQPVSRRTLVLAKTSLRFAVFLGVILALAAAALMMAGVDLASAASLPGLLLWVAAIVGYGLFWFALAIAITSLGRASAANAMMLAALWLLLVVLVPSLLNLLATTLYPVPSRVEMVQAVRVAGDEANEEGSKLLAQYYEDHPELAEGGAAQAMTDFNMIRMAVGTEVERRVRPVLERYERQLAAQQAVIDRLRILSPAILMQDALNDIAGSGLARHRHFMRQVLAYHDSWRAYFMPLIFRRAQLADFSAIPRFDYREEPAAAATGRVLLAIAAVVLPGLLLGAAGLRALRRYPVA